MIARRIGAWALAVIVLVPAAAIGQTVTRDRVLVLDPESKFLGAEKLGALGQQLRSLASRYSSLGILKAPGLGLKELRIRARCADSSAACLAGMGKALGATRVVHSEVQKLPMGYLVVMKLVDAEEGRELEQARKRARRSPDSVQSALLRAWVELMGPLYRSQLRVRANMGGAQVFLDGRKIGTTPLVLTTDLSKGEHIIELKLAGYQPVRRSIQIEEGKDFEIEATLLKLEARQEPPAAATGTVGGEKLGGGKDSDEEPVEVAGPAKQPVVSEVRRQPPPKKPEPFLPSFDQPIEEVDKDKLRIKTHRPFYEKWWFWTIVGAVVAGGVTGLVVGLTEEGGIPAGKGRVVIEF